MSKKTNVKKHARKTKAGKTAVKGYQRTSNNKKVKKAEKVAEKTPHPYAQAGVATKKQLDKELS